MKIENIGQPTVQPIKLTITCWDDIKRLMGLSLTAHSFDAVNSSRDGRSVDSIEIMITCPDTIRAVQDAINTPHGIKGLVDEGRIFEHVKEAYRDCTCKISAIKRLRELTYCGLAQAKNWVEANFDTNGRPRPPIPF